MPLYFFDTSAFVKYYHREPGSEFVDRLFRNPNNRIAVSNLGVLETESAFAMKVRSGHLNRAGAGAQRSRMMLDIAAGLVQVCMLLPEHFETARRLVGRYSFDCRLRTLDALQLAMAIDLWNGGQLERFVVADKVLLEVAAGERLPVANPEAGVPPALGHLRK